MLALGSADEPSTQEDLAAPAATASQWNGIIISIDCSPSAIAVARSVNRCW